MNRRVFALTGMAALLTGQSTVFPQATERTQDLSVSNKRPVEEIQESGRKATQHGTAMVHISNNATNLVTGVKNVAGGGSAVQ